MWRQAQDWLKRVFTGGGADLPAAADGHGADDVINPCCDQPLVHIAFRGKSDDRLYMAHRRKWVEVRYYQPYGLRVFCVKCRRRVL